MKRLAPLLLALTSLAHPSLTQAQGQTLAFSANLEVFVGGKELQNEQYVYIGNSKCKPGVEFEFRATRYEVDVPVLELWMSAGKGVDCTTPTNRQSEANRDSPCWLVTSTDNVQANTNVALSAPAVALFSREGKECEPVSNQIYTAYLVPLTTATQTGTGTASEALTNAQKLNAAFTLYTREPSEPTDLQGRSGETSLSVEWDRATGADEFTEYRVYYDTAQPDAAGVECGSGLLVEGKTPETSDDIVVESAKNESSSLSSLDGRVELGESVAVGVVTVDAAGNRSPLSEIICIERVPTDGFYDRYKDEGGTGLEKCAMQAPGKASWSGLGSLTLLALALVARRRRTT